jgi:hypothetical protein
MIYIPPPKMPVPSTCLRRIKTRRKQTNEEFALEETFRRTPPSGGDWRRLADVGEEAGVTVWLHTYKIQRSNLLQEDLEGDVDFA